MALQKAQLRHNLWVESENAISWKDGNIHGHGIKDSQSPQGHHWGKVCQHDSDNGTDFQRCYVCRKKRKIIIPSLFWYADCL